MSFVVLLQVTLNFKEKIMPVHINALEKKKKAESSALEKCHLTGVTW